MMAFTKETKKTIDLLVPAVLTAYVGYFFYTKNGKNWQSIAIAAGIAFLLSYIIVSQITKAVYAAATKPEDLDIKPDLSSGGTGSVFNPATYTDRLKKDIYSYGFRDASIYADLVALSTAELVQVYNDWNERYYSLDSETMIQAMNGESYGIGFLNETPTNVKNIIKRLTDQGAK